MSLSFPRYTATHLPPELYSDYSLNLLPVCSICHPDLYPRHGVSSAITAPSNSSGIFRRNASFSGGMVRSRMSELIISSYILSRINPNNSEYLRFNFKMINAANLFCAAKASAPGILSA